MVPPGAFGLAVLDRQQVQHRVLGLGVHVAAAERLDAIKAQRGAAALVAGSSQPQASQSNRLRPSTSRFSAGCQINVRHLENGVLQMGRDDFDIVLVERNEF